MAHFLKYLWGFCFLVTSMLFVQFGAAADLRPVNIPKLGPDDDFTYAVCPSAVVLGDDEVYLAVTVGRLVSGEWHDGYEQVRVYHYTTSGVSGEVIFDNRFDGYNGMFEACQLSLGFYRGNPIVYATTTYLPSGLSPAARYSSVGSWVFLNDAWTMFTPIVSFSFENGDGAYWSDRWLGDPVILNTNAGLLLYWDESLPGQGIVQWGGTPVWPATAVPVRHRVEFQNMDSTHNLYIADAALTEGTDILAIVHKRDDVTPPWPLAVGSTQNPYVYVGGSGPIGPSFGVWARNPTFFRDIESCLARENMVIFEATPDLTAPLQDVPAGDPVRFSIWVWGAPIQGLPITFLRGMMAVSTEPIMEPER